MEPRYDIKEIEARIYASWEESGFFNPDVCVERGVTAADAEPFSIVLPPPNVTGELHIGHASMLVIEDIMVRFNRMLGKRTLWIPGTDHAAIATQSKVEKLISKEDKKNRHDLGREAFLKRVNEYAAQSHNTITKQVKRMGSSLDWSREAYTLDDKREVAVRTAFKKMYDLGLIYRGDRVVNWDPKGQTVISDDEIVYEERKAKLYTFRYAKDFPIAIATTRPETKVGDTAIAIHPTDERYQKYIGQEFEVNFCGVPLLIKVIADESVEKEFGTGALGVTPAHSTTDWELSQKHYLPLVSVIDEYARMKISSAPQSPLNGMKTTEARAWVVEELQKNGLLEKEEEIMQNVSTAERTGGIIEPLPKLQWFVGVNTKFKLEYSNIDGIPSGSETTLKELMRAAVAGGQIKILPERFEKIYFHWIENLRDWCISRQIWFGHRIPVWYKIGGKDEIHVGGEAPHGENWEQDPDTLDTWFSSGLWPFSTLGWPFSAEAATASPAQDFATYFPNAVLETGYDILFFWVARMILMSTCLLGETPFRKVYLHGLVRDTKGQKMSKSLGNGIDPLDMADTYGADATRLSLIIGASAGNDTKLSEDRIRGYRNFSTKIWNIARFIQINKPAAMEANSQQASDAAMKISGRAEIKELEILKSEITNHLETFEFHLAGEKLYHYIWHTLADKIIESEKEKLRDGNDEEKMKSYVLLEHLLLGSLKMLHPFMPFITEEVYQIFKPGNFLMVEKW
jgi:valyl-tRNA synthetase